MTQKDISEGEKIKLKKMVKINASIPFQLHIVAKRMYGIQGKKMGERIAALLRSDLKRMLKTETFKQLPEGDAALFKAFIDMKDFYEIDWNLAHEEEG